MTNKHMKRSLASLFFREMEIKARLRCHLMPVRIAGIEKKRKRLGRMWRAGNPCGLLVGMSINVATLVKSMEAPQETKEKDYHIIQQFHTWVFIPQQAKTLIQKTSITCSPCSALFTTAEIWKQRKCLSTDEWIKIRRGACIPQHTFIHYLYNGILLSHEKRMKFCHLLQHGWT